MVNHPNRSGRMKWTRDGDQWFAKGGLGTYFIAEWILICGSNFAISFQSNSSRSKKGIGEFSTLANAKMAADQYDGYRART
jgi:hypothetical protein